MGHWERRVQETKKKKRRYSWGYALQRRLQGKEVGMPVECHQEKKKGWTRKKRNERGGRKRNGKEGESHATRHACAVPQDIPKKTTKKCRRVGQNGSYLFSEDFCPKASHSNTRDDEKMWKWKRKKKKVWCEEKRSQHVYVYILFFKKRSFFKSLELYKYI